jgi:hypothetical protein
MIVVLKPNLPPEEVEKVIAEVQARLRTARHPRQSPDRHRRHRRREHPSIAGDAFFLAAG